MAVINLAVGQVNITAPFLVAIARKVSDPIPIAAKEEYPTPLPAAFNVILPEAGELDPVNYYVDFYESSNGTSLDLLLSTFVVNAKNNIVISETRYYKVGNGGVNPEPDQPILSDSYLDGKTIASVYKDGVGRPLVPPPYDFKEYDPYPGGGIELLNGILFSIDEIVAVEISYLGEQVEGSAGGGLYNGVITLTEDTTLDSSHRNKRLRCASDGSNRMVHTLEDASVVPDGTFYHFTHNNGNQYQTKFIVGTGSFRYGVDNYSELWIMPGESIRFEKWDGTWEVVIPAVGILQVGEELEGTWKDHPNTMPEDGRLLDGDDYPRPWWWIKNKLPVTHIVVDDNVVNPGYTHPANKLGCFVVHSTLKKFRMPNTQNLSKRGLKNFSTYGNDGERLYDYPGGVQNEMIGPHDHNLTLTHGHSYSGGPNSTVFGNGASSPSNVGYVTSTTGTTGIGTENRVKNIGVIYLRRI